MVSTFYIRQVHCPGAQVQFPVAPRRFPLTNTTKTAADVAVAAKIWSLGAFVSRPTHAAKRTVQPLIMPSSACLFCTMHKEMMASKRRIDASMAERIAVKVVSRLDEMYD